MPGALSTASRKQMEQRAPAQLLEGTVLAPPLNSEGFLRIEVDGQPGVVQTCPWPYSGIDALPGDAVAVEVSDGGNYWAHWWPQNGQTPSGGGGGTLLSGEWKWTTSATNPASGRIGINTGAWNTATAVNIHKTTNAGGDASNLFAVLKVNDRLYIQQSNDSSRWGRYRINAALVDHGDWFEIPVTWESDGGTLPSNNSACRMTAVIGGAGGATFPPGGTPGEVLTFLGPGLNDVDWEPAPGAGGAQAPNMSRYSLAGTYVASTWMTYTPSKVEGSGDAAAFSISGNNIVVRDTGQYLVQVQARAQAAAA